MSECIEGPLLRSNFSSPPPHVGVEKDLLAVMREGLELYGFEVSSSSTGRNLNLDADVILYDNGGSTVIVKTRLFPEFRGVHFNPNESRKIYDVVSGISETSGKGGSMFGCYEFGLVSLGQSEAGELLNMDFDPRVHGLSDMRLQAIVSWRADLNHYVGVYEAIRREPEVYLARMGRPLH